MARPIKEGLDYFPLDVDIDQDDKIALIEANHGLEGFGVVIKLLMKIYDNSYFYEWGEKEQLLFSRRVNVNINKVNDIINDCLKWGLFSTELYEKHQILTSKGIQKRYLEASARRKEVKIYSHYLLLNEKEVNAYKNLVIVNINSIDDDISTQSKVKESKVKNKEEEEKDPAKFYDIHIGRINTVIKEAIEYWEQDLSPEIVIRAMKEAIYQNAYSWKYINNTLNSWHKQGAKTLSDVERIIREFEQKKVKPFKPKQPQAIGSSYDPSKDRF